MTKFIEVHHLGMSIFINLAHVSEIECDTYGGCTIYFAFSISDANDQAGITPDETYEQIKSKILGGE